MENAGMFRSLVENSHDIIFVADSQFRIIYGSPAVEKVFELPARDAVGIDVFDIIKIDRLHAWKSLLAKNDSFSEEISLTIGNGTTAYFDVHVSEFFINESRGVALQLHDITEKKLLEFSLIQSNQQLDQVIFKTTHDLRAPLSSAIGLVNLAEKAPTEEKDHYMEMIKKSLLKLDSFIEEMNDFFRNEKLAVRRELIRIEELLKDELDYLNNLSQRNGVQIDLTVAGNIDFYSDGIRVKTILTNILSNAIKYSDPKKITPFIRIFVSLDEDFCQIRVVDNGIGIEPRFQGKIFDLFFRATAQSQGTGLGLFIVKDTIEKLKGTIEVNSIPGEGTTFFIRIPNQIHQPIEVV
jgi:PAS domain S-box-containing protein